MRRFNFRKSAILFVITAICLTFVVTPAFAKKIFKLAHGDIEDPYLSPDAAAAVVFKSMVDSGTNGEVEVQIFPGLVLGKERELNEQLTNGLIQGNIASVGGVAPFWPLVGVLDTPFAFPNFSVAYDVLDGPFGDKLKQSILDKTGLRCLEITDANGFFNLTNSVRPIKSIADVKGIKFRTMTLPSHIAFFESMGASAIPISWAEIYTSLQTGVVDGQHNPLGYIISGKVHEVQKYLTLTRHILATHWFLANEDFLKSLSEDNQKVVRDAAHVANMASRGITRIVGSTEKGLPFLMKYLEVYQPTSAELNTFAEATIPAAQGFIKKTLGDEGAALQDDMLKAIEASKKKLGF